MDLIQVDPVSLQALKRLLNLPDYPAARVTSLVRIVAHRTVYLGCEYHVVAPAICQRLPDDLLRLSSRVDVGSVDEVDSRIKSTVDDPNAVVVVRVAPSTEHHRPKTKSTYMDAGSTKSAILHFDLAPFG